jgi:hypothetical protein
MVLGLLVAVWMARIRWPFALPKRDERRDGANDIDRRFQCVRIQRNASGDPLGGELQAQRNHTDAEAAPSGFYRARHQNEAAPWPVTPNSAKDSLPPSPCFGKKPHYILSAGRDGRKHPRFIVVRE